MLLLFSGRDSRGAARPTAMDLDPASPQPPEEVADMAYLLVTSAVRRGMEYEEFTFEVDGGSDDGEEYKVIVMKI